MTSSPDRGFTPASTAPAASPRVFLAAPAGSRGAGPAAPRERPFTTFEVPGGAEVEAMRESARASGYAAGWARGMQLASERAAAERAAERDAADATARAHEAQRRAALGRATSAVSAAAADLLAREEPLVGSLADTVLELALDLAGAVLDRELEFAASPVRDAVERALRPLAPGIAVTVRVHPDDLIALTGDGLKGSAAAADAPGVSFVADGGLQPGDAIARQGDTEVDARLRASVARALDALVSGPDGESGVVEEPVTAA
ncbi:hypothetical protein GTR02_13595 [Kineococcus sp. R8]|uniref:FliH/SctL family protein n=1 Tax=Kineococcus siccus TaxID=2696567 RepID=UPI001412C63D|nr:FliH/SctL family protein [Kineococcus siccus]NAZ82851.1 hypothetical protein [Kineococcus siccus]